MRISKNIVILSTLVVVLTVTGCGTGDEKDSSSPPEEKPENLNAPIDSGSDEEKMEYDASQNTTPEFFAWNCEDFSIPAGTNIGLFYEWTSQTEEQNKAYFEAAEHQVYVNDNPIDAVMDGLNGVEEDGQGYFKQLFWMDIGNYPAGTYTLRNVITFTEPVFDGWDWYGPDSDYAIMESECTVTVTGSGEAGSSAPTDDEEAEAPSTCSIDSSIREDWNTVLCETFEDDTVLWQGTSQGTSTRLEGGQYIIDNTTGVSQGYTTGFTFPVFAGGAPDHMISVDGELDSQFKNCTWGVFVRSKSDEIIYFFMINNQGRYTLTGSTDNDAARYLGNIDSGSHSAIVWDGVNNLTAVADGRELAFYINDEIVVTHEANNDTDDQFGLIVWGGEGVSAVTRFDNLLVRIQP